MKDILFVYQHKPREIESLCLLKLEMERRGYTSDLLCTFIPNRIFRFYRKARLTVSSALYDNNVLWFMVYDIVGFTKKIVNLQWEQVLSNSDEANINCYHNPKGFAKNVIHLCWGNRPQKRIIQSGVQIENAPVTGAVHLDFLRQEFNSYFFSKEELALRFQIDSQAQWCLFISSFTLHNMTEEEFTQIFECYGEEIKEFKKITILSKIQILTWIEHALIKHPEKIVIYRPHPDETRDRSLLLMEEKYSNFKIISDLSIKQWIKCSELIYTWYSTAAAEISEEKKGFDILRPIAIPLQLDISFYKDAKFVEKEEFFLNSFNAASQENPLDIDLLHEYYRTDDSYPAYMKVADILERTLISNDLDMKIHYKPIFVNLRIIWKRIRIFLDRLIMDWLGPKAIKVPFIGKSIEYSIAFNERIKRDISKNLASEEEIEAICNRLRPIVNANLFSKKK